jgi:protein SERAC1
MNQSPDITDQANLKSTYGCLFFGVPNQGIDISSLIPMVGNQDNLGLLTSIGRESELLRKQNRDFNNAFDYKDSEIISFFETESSPTAKKVSTD